LHRPDPGGRGWSGYGSWAGAHFEPPVRRPVGVRRVRFPPEVITVAVRRNLRYGLSYRDVEELLAERGVEVDQVTVCRWGQRYIPLFADAARPLRHATGDRWFVAETDVKPADQEWSSVAP
jgi:transposase-like protein